MRASHRHRVRCSPSTCQAARVIRPKIVCAATGPVPDARVVVIGGTGRVGSSTASALIKEFPNLKITLASRSDESYQAAVSRRPELSQAAFQRVDITNADSVRGLLNSTDADLVIHTAGPFQRSKNYAVLEAALDTRTPYIDVCDDTPYSEGAKAKYAERAKAEGVPAIVSGGIYPGTSNVMAAHIISIARQEYDEGWNYRTPPPGEGVEPKWLRYSYYTAGSGGAGPTILETSFLLAGEDVIVYKDGKEVILPPISNRREVDFGPGVGRKGVYLYNLPEVVSGHKYMRVPDVSARFGTDPFIWNWAMWLTARLIPRKLLNDRGFVKRFAALSDPFVRNVDKIIGEAVAMRVEVDMVNGKNSSGIFVHKYLSQSMGYSTAAFAQSVLQGKTKPGVWYPEEPEALQDRRQFLQLAATGCSRFDLNRSAWALESEIKQIGGLIYW
ncbi:hypothetical protein VOLCADRAFT_95342 [Volvox carteri f. nagariensis]|uniref:Saccharopine dehydrogenase NADP binding domain-containing protein n=1 Tax=Volvox carteri f. nagariensis TaxID=3068 RepID=D8U771_VOLCA|nr:uncharacterized protein VOLCADRAFT_95342 [Volvox carteri f. nagariensis]EFJ44432.1 hypothetical protein VOLCADRAFT_95342 [Volvox carteri f. nagariensis]|eukprot:XP_002954539.1 hypothetical protein VOLCADRAFT_95342 [Volvox carteri f. nagariensis]